MSSTPSCDRCFSIERVGAEIAHRRWLVRFWARLLRFLLTLAVVILLAAEFSGGQSLWMSLVIGAFAVFFLVACLRRIGDSMDELKGQRKRLRLMGMPSGQSITIYLDPDPKCTVPHCHADEVVLKQIERGDVFQTSLTSQPELRFQDPKRPFIHLTLPNITWASLWRGRIEDSSIGYMFGPAGHNWLILDMDAYYITVLDSSVHNTKGLPATLKLRLYEIEKLFYTCQRYGKLSDALPNSWLSVVGDEAVSETA